MRSKGLGFVAALALSFLAFGAQRSDAKCDPTGADAADVARVRGLVADNCDCAGTPNHGTFVSCAAEQARELANNSCRGLVVKCAARSTCGKPGFVTCCRTKASGTTKCSTKSSGDRCKAPKNGSACVSVGNASCCDACTASGCASSPSGAFLADF